MSLSAGLQSAVLTRMAFSGFKRIVREGAPGEGEEGYVRVLCTWPRGRLAEDCKQEDGAAWRKEKAGGVRQGSGWHPEGDIEGLKRRRVQKKTAPLRDEEDKGAERDCDTTKAAKEWTQ
jgi:hypothetical protein